MPGATVADIIESARGLTGTEKTKQVTNDQLGEWANAGLGALYDAVIQADESYYSVDAPDMNFGSGSQAAATLPLPDDFYRARGLKRFPDTAREHPVFPVTLTDTRKIGYVLRGNTIQITPQWQAASGPYRLSYAPLPPKFGRVLDTSVAAGDGIVDGSPVSAAYALKCRNGNFSLSDGQSRSTSLVLYNDKLASENTAYPDGYPLQWVGSVAAPVSTPSLIGLAGVTTGQAAIEAFDYKTIAVLVHSGEITNLDTILDPYRHFIVCYVAAKILEKKKQSTQDMVRQMNAEIERFVASLPDRESEPEAAPCLWRPSFHRYGGPFHGGGF